MFNNPLADIPMFTGLIFIVAALLLLVLPPKSPNWFYGYRTKRSMKSLRHWKFAQNYSAKQMLLSGLASMAFSSSGWLLEFSQGVEVSIGIAWLLLVTIALIFRVEKALVKEFGE